MSEPDWELRIAAAIDELYIRTGERPYEVHVAPDVWAALEAETQPRIGPGVLRITCDGVPIIKASRLPAGMTFLLAGPQSSPYHPDWSPTDREIL